MNKTIEPSILVADRSFRVLRFSLEEALGKPGRLVCSLYDDDAPLPRPGELIGERAVFRLDREDGAEARVYSGLVFSAELAPGEDDVPALEIEIAPRLRELERRADCRIFQEKSVRTIVSEVLEAASIPASSFEWRLAEDHPDRVYVAQYRETDLDFVMRLLAEEGIWFAVVTQDDEDRIVFCDAPDGLGDVEGEKTLTYFEDFGFETSSPRVHRVTRAARVRSDKVFVRDYDPEKPSVAVEGEAEGEDPGAHSLEIYEWPARTSSGDEAKQRARVLCESVQADRDVVSGEASTLGLLPGRRVSIDGHPYDPINEEYLVTESALVGRFPRSFSPSDFELRVSFSGIPTAKSRYRLPRRPRARELSGAQTALTTGPSGEEIHTDKAGRVKIAYPWDRSGRTDDTSSLWVRTLQLPIGGSMLLPRVGWEVVVNHEGGDVDRPLVFGRMYNALTMPPYGLPGGASKSALQTATTPGGGSVNELRMGDGAGQESLSFNASKDMSTQVNNNMTESIGNDLSRKIGAKQSRSVTNSQTETIGADESLTVSGNQSIKVETFHVDQIGGSHTLTIGGNRDMKVGGDHKRDVGGSVTHTTGGNAVDLVVGSVSEDVLGSAKVNVGAALVDLAVGNRTVDVGANRTETAGAAKVVAVAGGRAVDVGGSLDVKAGGAIINVASGTRAEKAGGTFTELAAGAQIVKAANVVFEGQSMVTLVMGASVLSLTPASVIILGVSVKLDGDVKDTAALIVDN